MDCSLPGSSVHGIFQAWILEWIAISFSSGSSRPRDQTLVSHIVGRCFTVWATREAGTIVLTWNNPKSWLDPTCAQEPVYLCDWTHLKIKTTNLNTIEALLLEMTNSTLISHPCNLSFRWWWHQTLQRKIMDAITQEPPDSASAPTTTFDYSGNCIPHLQLILPSSELLRTLLP